jgi:hypothetical protein
VRILWKENMAVNQVQNSSLTEMDPNLPCLPKTYLRAMRCKALDACMLRRILRDKLCIG